MSDKEARASPKVASAPAPKVRMVKISGIFPVGTVLLEVRAETGGRQYEVEFDRRELDGQTNPEATKQYIARQVLAAAATEKEEPLAPPEYLPLLGSVEVEV